MKASIYNLFCLIVIATLILILTPAIQAQTPDRDCSWLVAGRTYAFQFGGYFNFGPSSSQFPNAGGGMVTFLHNGKARGKLTLIVGENIFRAIDGAITEDMSSYSLKWDTAQMPAVCHGTASLNGPDVPPGDFMVLVTDGGNRLELIHNELGITLSSTALPMERDRCDNHSLHGNYSYNANGWIMPPPPPNFPPVDPSQTLSGFVPFAFSGVISFRPNGKVPASMNAPAGSSYLQGWDFVLLDGLPTPRVYSGWYKVNPDCTAVMTLEDNIGNAGPYAIHTENYILRGGEGLHVVNTNPGTALSFTSWKVQ